MEVLVTILTVSLVVVCLALVGIILIQRGKGGGLAAAFGGGGVEQAFGTRAATMAQKATVILAFLFLVLSVVLGRLYQESHIVPSMRDASKFGELPLPPPPAPEAMPESSGGSDAAAEPATGTETD